MMKRFIFLLLSLALSVFVFGQNQMFLRSTQAPPSGAGILDAYPGAAFAAAPDVLIYSSHSVTDNTAGSQTNGQTGQFTVLVQRDSDNALRSFTYTEVSDGTLSAWVGPANNGTVQILYDQSGNNNHATQATAANQPRIVVAGSLVVENGKAAMDFDGVDNTLDLTSTINLSSYLILSTITNRNYGATSAILGLFLSDYIHFNSSSNTIRVQPIGSFGPLDGVNNTRYLFSFSRNTSNNAQAFKNAGEIGSTITNSTSLDLLFIAQANDIWFFDGLIQNIIIYSSDQSANRTAIEAPINNEYNIY